MVACPLTFFFITYSQNKCSVPKIPGKNKKLWTIYLWKKKNSPELISTYLVRPELICGPLCFQRANPHKHMISLAFWGQSSAGGDKADYTVWKSHSHSQDLTAKFSHWGSRVQEKSFCPSSATTSLMSLVTTFHDNHPSFPSLWVVQSI